MGRLTTESYFMKIAKVVSERATCVRRQVGCVLVNSSNHIIATGYNGVPRGFSHCQDVPCTGAKMASGTGLELCLATHAEQNALLQCTNVDAIDTAYCTTFPCIHCIKLLLNTSAKRIVFIDDYSDVRPYAMWTNIAGRAAYRIA